jgi:hypothetical protein
VRLVFVKINFPKNYAHAGLVNKKQQQLIVITKKDAGRLEKNGLRLCICCYSSTVEVGLLDG